MLLGGYGTDAEIVRYFSHDKQTPRAPKRLNDINRLANVIADMAMRSAIESDHMAVAK